MKLKRFVAVVISLAMVLSIVPAFSLTASAAEEVVLFDATSLDRTDSTGDIALSEGNWSGDWGAVFSNNWGDNTGTWGSNGPTALMFFRTSARQNGSSDYKTATYGGASASAGANKITISFRYAIQDVSDCYQTWYFRDIDGNNFARFYGDKNTGSGTASVGLNTQTTFISSGGTLGIRGQEFSIVATQGASNWTVEYYQGTTLLSTDTVDSINGFGSVYADIGQWNTQWAASGMQGLKITYEMPETAKEIVATYTAGGTTVSTVSKTIDTSLTDSASFDEYYYAADGSSEMYYAAAQSLSESGTIEMTKLTNADVSGYAKGGTYATDTAVYNIVSDNLIPNGDFAYGINGWLDGAGAAPTAFTVIGDGTVQSTVNGGNGGNGCLYRAWPIESGKTYLYTYSDDFASGDANWRKLSLSNALGSEETYVVIAASTTDTLNTVFTNTDGYAYAKIRYRWNGDALKIGNFGLYEIEEDASKKATTTIKFVDSSDNETEIADAVTVTGIVGSTITIADYAPSTITYNGNPYSFDSSNPTTYTVVGNTDVVTLTYTTDAYVSFTADAVTVIEGNDPIMPTTVTAVTGAGSTTVVSGATWTGYTGLSAGTHEVSGTVTIEGTTVSGTTTVTVLPMTFSSDAVTGGGTINFPADVTGDFYVEFDFNASNLDNMWIYLSADGALWGSGQIGLGWDNAGNGYFRAQPAAQTDIVFETGKTYRFLVHGNVDTDTYDLTVYDTVTSEVIFTCDDYAFRSGSDYINSIVVTSNGEGGVANVTNVKTYAPNQADLFTTITFVAEGSVSDTYTTTYTSAEEFPIPHYDGHIMKTRTISGDTVTATYEATTTSTGSWYMRNNFTDDNWLSQSKYVGSHNAFAADDSVFDNEGGALYGDSATNGSSTYVSKSRAQSVGALDQLNAGVRYFDIRLSRQEDGTFAVTHGPAFENFRNVAITLAQWAKENPGEVIILDFQTVRDALYGGSATGSYDVITDNDSYYGPDAGDDNQYVYDALVQLFKDTGLADYLVTGWNQKYGPITNYGEKAVIIPFGKGRAVNCQGSYFTNRSALYNDVTYTEASSYDDIVSNLDSTYSSLAGGATICTIHAYTTPGVLSSASLLSSAASNNPNWINEANFEAWMGYDKGDVFMMNDSVSNIDLYYNKLNSFNRTGSTYSYSANFTRTDDGVTIDGAQANVPYSTKFTVDVTNNEVTTTIDGVDYTTKAAYNVALMQFNTNSVPPTGEVTLTFPKASADDTTVDVLFFNDEVVYTAGVGEAISYTTSELGTYVVATKVAPSVEYTVNYAIDGTVVYTDGPRQFLIDKEAYNFAASTTGAYVTFGGKAYIVTNEAQSKTITADDVNGSSTVNFTLVHDNAVLYDTFGNNDGSNDCNNTANMLFIGSAGISDPGDADADASAMANAGGNVGSPRIPVLTFNVPTVADGQAVKLNLYVAKANQNLNNGSMKLAVGTADIVVDETLGYKAADIANTTDIIWSDQMFTAVGDATDGRREVNSWVTVDVTEFVKATTSDTITFTLYAPTAGAYVADREKAVAGGAYEGLAAYLEVVDTYTVAVSGASKITRNGNLVDSTTEVVAYEGAQIKLYETSSDLVAFTDFTKVYATSESTGETPYITVAGDAEYTAVSKGLTSVDGAQVRIGYGVNSDGKVGSESGLRFITLVDYADSLASVTGAEMGVEITAEGSSAAAVKIVAEQFQNADNTVYTSALTNLAEGNFNRKFTATPYVTVDGQTFYGTPVTRSIYQVAAGLLVNTDTDGTEYDQSALDSTVLYKVLNAYVNQTGIRLSVTSEGLTAYTGTGTSAYSGDQFFEVVSSETVSENVYAITIKPAGDKTTINSYWQEYIRINNNNSAIKDYTSMVDNGDGTVTITFDYASYLAQ